MPSPDKTLRETLTEVVGETKETPPAEKSAETKEELSKKEGETKAGETPEYVAGIDISDIPAEDRVRFKAKLEEKLKLLEKGYQGKFQEIAKFKKAQEELVSMGLTQDEAYEVLTNHIKQKKNPAASSTEKKEAVRTLDKLIQEAPAEQRSALEQMRQIILEETNVSALAKKVEDMEKILDMISQDSNSKRQKELETDLVSLESKYGKDLVEQYKDEVLKQGLMYKASAKQLLHAIVPADELEQAILDNVKKDNKVKDKKEAISSPGSGITSSKEQIDTKQSWKNVISELIKK